MNIIKPARLNKGDLIGIISPASSPDDLTRIEKGVCYLEKLGYRTEVAPNVGKVNGYLAGTDEERVSDLHYMFGKKEVKAIMCVRGGYGTPRLLDKIDYNLIKKNPKIFVGYSDITSLHLAIHKKTGLVTFAGPMLAVDFWNEVSSFTEEMFWTLISSKKKFGKISNPENEKFYVLKNGKARGQLLGGNFTHMLCIAGTPYLPSFEEKILLLEEIGEAPYRVDRMLTHLRLLGIFEKIKAVILGRFVDCYESDQYKKSLTLNEVIDDHFRNVKFPVIYNFKHGHIKDNITVPQGINYRLDTSDHTIEIMESAVE